MGSTDTTADSDLKWQQVVTAVAAAAGGAAWVSAVGSGVVAVRLRQADLPIEPVVALMSTEHRFAIGAGILIAPLLAGFIGFLADWVAGKTVSHRRRQALAVGTVLGGAALVYVLLKPPFETFAFESVAVAAAVPIAFQFLPKEPEKRHRFPERLAVFLSVLVAAGAGAILAESFGAPSFDETEITIRDQPAPVTGGYITSTEHSVVLSTRCEVIEAVPRDQIERISVGPDEVKRTHC
jgi:hypothetical protein